MKVLDLEKTGTQKRRTDLEDTCTMILGGRFDHDHLEERTEK